MQESSQKSLNRQESSYNDDIESYLKKNGEIMIAPVGYSMLPLLKGDSCQVILKAVTQPPKPYDVVLYRALNGKLILHRILGRKRDGYRIRGDNTYHDETGIQLEQILGVMSGFYRGERFISAENRKYRIYSRVWVWIYPVRKFLVAVIRFLWRGRK